MVVPPPSALASAVFDGAAVGVVEPAGVTLPGFIATAAGAACAAEPNTLEPSAPVHTSQVINAILARTR